MPVSRAFRRVFLVEPNASLRGAVLAVLEGAEFEVTPCDTLDQVLVQTSAEHGAVALVAWQAMDGLLADDHRNHLLKLTHRVRLVIMVPRRWSRLLDATDLGDVVAGIVPKPFEADELIAAVRAASREPVDVSASS